MVEFNFWVEDSNKGQDITAVYDSMLDVSRAFISEWEEMMEMQAFRGGTITAYGLNLKYVREDGFTRKVWVVIDEAEEF